MIPPRAVEEIRAARGEVLKFNEIEAPYTKREREIMREIALEDIDLAKAIHEIKAKFDGTLES